MLYLGLLEGGGVHVNIVAQAAAQDATAVNHVEGKREEHQPCTTQNIVSFSTGVPSQGR